jgi:hypothetical protein
MSHNVTLTGVKIKDLNLLSKVVNDLSKGVAILHKDQTTFRTFPGQPNNCDAAIVLPGHHDVGLLRNADGTYTPVFDPYAMTDMFKSRFGTNQIGAMMQEYTLREAEYEASRNGFTATRVPGEKGTVTLELVPVSA